MDYNTFLYIFSNAIVIAVQQYNSQKIVKQKFKKISAQDQYMT